MEKTGIWSRVGHWIQGSGHKGLGPRFKADESPPDHPQRSIDGQPPTKPRRTHDGSTHRFWPRQGGASVRADRLEQLFTKFVELTESINAHLERQTLRSEEMARSLSQLDHGVGELSTASRNQQALLEQIEPFNIPSESMLPTLLVGDYIFVSKFSYGYSRHSVIFSPDLGEGRIFESNPKRGDVAVFKLPRDNETDYIKRIIGLPGDKLQMRRGVLHINGVAVGRERIDDYRHSGGGGREFAIPQYRETLPNGVQYNTLDMIENNRWDDTKVYTVPPEHYFAMGDNRDNSVDSRVIDGGVGYIPAENLVGQAEFKFFSTDYSAALWELWKWPQAIRFSRIFRDID